MREALYIHGLVRMTVKRLAFPGSLTELLKVAFFFSFVLGPAPETLYVMGNQDPIRGGTGRCTHLSIAGMPARNHQRGLRRHRVYKLFSSAF
jgi:hypothetical protein